MPVCVYCGGTDFYEGPRGGASVNILCANPECRHWFNYMEPLDKLDDLEKVEPTEEEKEAERQRKIKEVGEFPIRMYQEGVDAFDNGDSLFSIIDSKPYGHQSNGADIYRIAGYIDTLTKHTHQWGR